MEQELYNYGLKLADEMMDDEDRRKVEEAIKVYDSLTFIQQAGFAMRMKPKGYNKSLSEIKKIIEDEKKLTDN